MSLFHREKLKLRGYITCSRSYKQLEEEPRFESMHLGSKFCVVDACLIILLQYCETSWGKVRKNIIKLCCTPKSIKMLNINYTSI